MNDTAKSTSSSAPVAIVSARRHGPLKNPTSYPVLAGAAFQSGGKGMVPNPASEPAEELATGALNPASELAEEPAIRIRARLQACRNPPKMNPASAAGVAISHSETNLPAAVIAAERRKNAAHGASRGKKRKTSKPQRGERSILRVHAIRIRACLQACHKSPKSNPASAAEATISHSETSVPAALIAAERRKNAAHGASRGEKPETTEPQRGERRDLAASAYVADPNARMQAERTAAVEFALIKRNNLLTKRLKSRNESRGPRWELGVTSGKSRAVPAFPPARDAIHVRRLSPA